MVSFPKRISPQESAPSSVMNSPREHNLIITEFNRGSIPYMRCARILRTPTLLCLLLFCSFTCLMLWMIYVQFSTLPGYMFQPLRTIDQSFNDSLMRIGGVSRPNPETKDVEDVILVSLTNEKPRRETEAISNGNLLPILDFQDLGVNKKKVTLLIIVSTAPARFERRQAIRGTWWKHCIGDMVKCVFITDGFIKDYFQRTLTVSERNTYKDMELQALQGGWEFGLRFLHHIRWAMAKFDFQYLLRIDDDYFLCLKRLLEEISLRPKDNLVWGHFHCEAGITWIDESFLLFSKNIIQQFLAQNESTMLCHPHADQQIGIWLQDVKIKQYFHDTRLYHDPPASYAQQFKNATNLCSSYLGLHGTYANTMWAFGKNANDGAKDVYAIPPFSSFCQATTFDYRKIYPPYHFEPKPCKDNPSWNVADKMFTGREHH
ncbi:uncharacterized protein [Porites lutea]|uniref:uncharacterized protein n=1 Tax=Porites lutea TaxID=51062 RepID=UPI003CC5A2E2